MYNAFIGLVVGIDEQTTPTFWKSTSIHCKSVVLCRNVAAYRVVVGTWQVMSPISIPTRNRCEILDMHTRDCLVQQVVSTSSLQGKIMFLFHCFTFALGFLLFVFFTEIPSSLSSSYSYFCPVYYQFLPLASIQISNAHINYHVSSNIMTTLDHSH